MQSYPIGCPIYWEGAIYLVKRAGVVPTGEAFPRRIRNYDQAATDHMLL